MSTRLTYSLSDENHTLHKQIGCMNGIFQIFDRRYFLGDRNVAARNRKKLPPAASGQNEEIMPMERNGTVPRTPGKKHKKNSKEKQRISTESSRTSFSSTTSCSSSFSSLDYNRAAHLETSLCSQSDLPGNTMREFSKHQQCNPSKQLSSQTFGFRDIVKENINKEVYGISVKTAAREAAADRAFKHVDSPRPTRSVEYDNSKTAGSNESFRVLGRLREAHRNAKEENDISPHSAAKINRRLSYDGRESYDTLKSTIKIRELPRLSLDSKESWSRRSASGARSNDPVKDMQKGNRRGFDKIKDDLQEPVSSSRPSTVVAKLMGLEALSDSTSTTNSPYRLINVYPTHDLNALPRSSRINDDNTQNRFSGSPRISHGDSFSPRLKNNHTVINPNASSKLPMETTQKSQGHRQREINEPSSVSHELAMNSFSVYGEIEKRLATLEFAKSGKDLRALKQILEAMQKSRAMLDAKEQAPDLASQTSTQGTYEFNRSSGASSRNLRIDNSHSSKVEVSSTSKANKSSIIIMKPAKNIGKMSSFTPSVPSNHHDASGMHSIQDDHSFNNRNQKVNMQSTKDLGPQHTQLRSLPSHSQPVTDKNTNTRVSKSTKPTKEHCVGSGTEISTASGNSPRVTSSRLHRKFGLEKQSCPTTPSSDSSRTKRITDREVGTTSTSTQIKLRNKSPGSNQKTKSTQQSTKSRVCAGDVNRFGNALPLQSESKRSVASHTDREEISNSQFDTTRSDNVLKDECKERNLEASSSDSGTIAKLTLVCSEQQSPVSVLDSSFYQDDSPSPIKKISYTFEDDETLNSEAESIQRSPVHAQKSADTLSTEIKILKSEIDNLRKSIQLVNCSNKEVLKDNKNPLYEGMNSQHKYISEILFESDLLKDLDHGLFGIQLHSPGHMVNPDVFLALEQSKAFLLPLNGERDSNRNSRSDARNKVQRKLVFDAVNEILLDKLMVECSSKQLLSSSKIAGTESRGQHILRELCTQVDQLQISNQKSSLNDDDASRNMMWKDLMHPSKYWGDYQNHVAGIVLDVERLIFKDLITEVVKQEASGLPGFSDNKWREFNSN